MFTIHIEDTEKKFHITIKYNGRKVYECGWYGGEFELNHEKYTVMGPYHGLDEGKFCVYKLVAVTEPF